MNEVCRFFEFSGVGPAPVSHSGMTSFLHLCLKYSMLILNEDEKGATNLLKIESLNGKMKAKAPAAEAAEPVKKPSLKSMKKAELIAFAQENNIEIDEKATNAVMIETIEAALK